MFSNVRNRKRLKMYGNLMLLGILATVYVLPVTGVQLSMSAQRVLPEPGTVTLTCSVDETDVASVLVMQIKMYIGQALTQLGLLTGSKNITSTIPTEYADRMTVSGSIDQTATNSRIMLTIDQEKIQCEDGTIYQCELTYLTNDVQNPKTVKTIQNGTLEVYENPSIMTLEGRLNAIVVEGPTVNNKAQFKVGDQLELTCSANVGSIQTTVIQWRRTSEIGNIDTFIEYNPPFGTSSETDPVKSGCAYTKTATIRYNLTVADANRQNNLVFECYVRLTTPPYNNYETTDNKRFYAEVSGGSSGNQEAVASAGAGGNNTGAIVGGVIGGLAAIVIIVVIVWFLWFRPRGGESYTTKEDRPNYPNQAPPMDEYTADNSRRRGHENRGLDEPHETRKKERNYDNGRGRANYGMDDDDYNSRDGSPTMTHHGINPSDGSFGTGV